MSFAYIPEYVIDKWHAISFPAKAVVVTIASFMGTDNQPCFPSINSLMIRSGIKTRRTVRKAINELVEEKLMSVERQEGKSNLYSWTKPLAIRAGGTPNTTGNKCPTTPYTKCTPKDTNKDTKKDTKKDTTRRDDKKNGRQSQINGGTVWKWWVGANNSAGRRAPVRNGADLAAAKSLAKQIVAEEIGKEELLSSMTIFLADEDKFLIKNGHGLRFLPGKMNAYLNSGPVSTPKAVQREKEFESASNEYGESGLEDRISERDEAAKETTQFKSSNRRKTG